MPDSMTYRGKPPYSQGNTSDNDLDRLVKTGVTDLQQPYRPDPMDAITDGIGDGQFRGQSASAIKAAVQAQATESLAGGLYQALGEPIDMKAASSSAPNDQADKRYGPVFPGGE